MHTYKVFYYKDLGQAVALYHEEPPGPYSADTIDETHVEVAHVDAEHLSTVYYTMQAEVWSPCGEALELITDLGLTHTSMSVGDIVLDDAGVYWLCLPLGWHILTPGDRQATEEHNV